MPHQGEPYFVNSEVRRQLGDRREYRFQAYSGTDIQALIYLPLLTKGSINNNSGKKMKVFAELQTISISSTRSVSPVRVLGRSSPIHITRGANTFAGTLVFASLNTDPFADVYDYSIAEGFVAGSSSLVADQLPPFSVVITASNESGAAAIQAIHGITLTNYGTTYSVDDLYTETTYTFVATDIIPLISDNRALQSARDKALFEQGLKSVSDLISDSMQESYGTIEQYVDTVKRREDRLGGKVLYPDVNRNRDNQGIIR